MKYVQSVIVLQSGSEKALIIRAAKNNLADNKQGDFRSGLSLFICIYFIAVRFAGRIFECQRGLTYAYV